MTTLASPPRPRTRTRALLGSTWFRRTVRLVVGAATLVAVVARVGTGPFVHGLLSVDLRVVIAAILLFAIATGAAAWRWRTIAGRLGVGLAWPIATAMYYRSQFVNSVLPGGVVGDVQRAVTHGHDSRSLPQASRAVVIERTTGLIVQVGTAIVVLAFFGAEFEGYLLAALAIGLAVLVTAAMAATAASARARIALRREIDELRAGVGSPAALVQVVVASLIVVACHVATFAVATSAVGAHVPPLRLAALALVVLLAASIPFNVGGWGPREGIAGWAFAVAGLGASTGVAASTLFGILGIVAVAPGTLLTFIHRRGEDPS